MQLSSFIRGTRGKLQPETFARRKLYSAAGDSKPSRMSLFGDSSSLSSTREASVAAGDQAKSYEKLLALRISLQKVLDSSNKLPVLDGAAKAKNKSKGKDEDHAECMKHCSSALESLTKLLNMQSSSSSLGEGKELSWEDVYAPQQKLRGKWETVVNKWHARLNFGSEKAQSNLRVFNQKIWEQIETNVKDEVRTIEKSRMPLHDSERIGRLLEEAIPEDQEANDSDVDDDDSDEDSDSDSDGGKGKGNVAAKKRKRGEYDLEVYDDRPFYSMLLKTFITSGSGGDGSSSMRAADLSALKKYKRNKVKVDRKASKGRKLRYIAHKKLENFMFPQHLAEPSINSERLFNSLFQ